MSHLILVRHGQSEWNLQKKFTGWVDVELAPNGKLEACKSGELIKELNLNLDYFFCSYQKRAIETLNLILNTLRIKNNSVVRAWEFNERNYGSLTGLNKEEMKKKLGAEKVYQFRRSWDLRPDPLDKNNPYHPVNIKVYDKVPRDKVPNTESLKDTYMRVIEFYKKEIKDKSKDNNILISAHGNSIRALCKYLFNLDENQISKLEIPTGNPLVINFNAHNEINTCKYLDQERAKDLVVF